MPDLDEALREGLRALPVPAVCPDFDARVLQALRAPTPWWRRWWQPAKPLLAGASFSLIAMLTLLHWSLSVPLGLPMPASPPPVLAARPAPSLDALLDRPNLSAASLSDYWAARPPDPPPPDRRPEPRRRAQVFCRACPIA